MFDTEVSGEVDKPIPLALYSGYVVPRSLGSMLQRAGETSFLFSAFASKRLHKLAVNQEEWYEEKNRGKNLARLFD